MALKPCPECGNEVSTEAAACPKCGRPNAKEAGKSAGLSVGRGVLIGVLVLGMFGAVAWLAGKDSASDREAARTPPSPEPAEMRERRATLIANLQGEGLFGKVECRGGGGEVWVKPIFSTLTFDEKQDFIGVVYAHCFGSSVSSSFVTLRDDRTGKDVGTFWGNRGLELE